MLVVSSITPHILEFEVQATGRALPRALPAVPIADTFRNTFRSANAGEDTTIELV